MRRPRVLIIGDSHATAIADAVAARATSGKLDGGSLDFFASRFSKVKGEGKIIPGLSPEQAETMVRQAEESDTLICAFGGNQYNTLGLLQHEQPFDLIDPKLGKDPEPTTARIIPLAQMSASFDLFVAGIRPQVERYSSIFAGRSFLLNPPPPKSDNDYIRQNAEAYFRDDGEVRLTVSPAGMRRRLWLAQSLALERMCDAIGVGFIDAPDDALDPDGFLRREAYGRDATHANALYGEHVLRQIEAMLTNEKEEA